MCSLQSLGRVESRLFAEPSESIDIELERPEPKWKWKLSLTCLAFIDQLIAKLTVWRGKTFASIGKSILEADREIIEQWKWRGGPVWPHDGMIAVVNAHKDKVKLTFPTGEFPRS